MLATNSPSAGVYSTENDRSQRISALSTSIGAVVGASKRGPVGERTLITDTTELTETFGMKDPRVSYAHYCGETFLKEASRLYFTRVAVDALLGGVIVTTDNNYSTTRPVSEGFDNPDSVTLGSSDIMLVYGANEGEWNNDVYIVFYPDTNDPDNQLFYLEVYEGQSTIAVERFSCTTFEYVDESGEQRFVETVINEQSSYIRVKFNTGHEKLVESESYKLVNALGGGPKNASEPDAPHGQLTGGDDGLEININDSDEDTRNQSVAAIIEAWDLYEDWEEVSVNILINAGYTNPAIQYKMDELAEFRQDCIAVLDLPSTLQEVQEAINYRRGMEQVHGLEFNLNSSLSTMFGPDVLVRDTDNGMDVWVPVSGHVAAVMAKTDRVDAAWFAPAGLNRGILTDVIKPRYVYDQGERDALVENQINPVRVIDGSGVVLWGADTLYGQKSALTDIGVRRMLAMLHAAIRINNLWAVFQPNDDILRSRQRQALEDLLRPIREGRGLDWYEVVCDERNNTAELTANGDVIVDVYLDPTVYAKRIHLNAVIPKTGQVQFAEELISQS